MMTISAVWLELTWLHPFTGWTTSIDAQNLHFLTEPQPAGVAQGKACGDRILDRHADGLEEGDLIG